MLQKHGNGLKIQNCHCIFFTNCIRKIKSFHDSFIAKIICLVNKIEQSGIKQY